jgi:hypothetical protein
MLSALSPLLNKNRKDNFKPITKGSFKKITYTNNSVTDRLFSDELQKMIEVKIRKISISNFDDKPSGVALEVVFSSTPNKNDDD